MNKFELITCKTPGENGLLLFQIRALKDISRFNIKKGDLGGFVSSEKNLSQLEDCWIEEGSMVLDNSFVDGNAYICGKSVLSQAVHIQGETIIKNSILKGNIDILENSELKQVKAEGTISILGKNEIVQSILYGNVTIEGNNKIHHFSRIQGEEIFISGDNSIRKSSLSGTFFIKGKVRVINSTLRSEEHQSILFNWACIQETYIEGIFQIDKKSKISKSNLINARILVRDKARIENVKVVLNDKEKTSKNSCNIVVLKEGKIQNVLIDDISEVKLMDKAKIMGNPLSPLIIKNNSSINLQDEAKIISEDIGGNESVLSNINCKLHKSSIIKDSYLHDSFFVMNESASIQHYDSKIKGPLVGENNSIYSLKGDVSVH